MIEKEKEYLLQLYHRLPIYIDRGRGSYLINQNGTRYLDMTSSIAVHALGYHHKVIRRSTKKQLKRYLHLSNHFITTSGVQLAEELIKHSFASKVFYTNSGTEANEAAFKLCRAYGKRKDTAKVEIISLQGSFHGRTSGSLSLTGQEEKREKFTPLLDHIYYIERNNINDLKKVASKKTAAIFLELIQGENGIHDLDQVFVEEVVRLATVYDFLVVVDEIQTGLYRTGSLFAYQQFGFLPDIVTLAKSLGGGFPLGAMLVNQRLENILSIGDHGSTFGGNAVACANGFSLFRYISRSSFQESLKIRSQLLLNKLLELQVSHSTIIQEIRGRGFMIGLEVGKYANKIKEKGLKYHMILNITSKTIVRLLPPLTITTKEIKLFIKRMRKILLEIEEEKE